MVQFAATFPDEPIVATLSRQLSWSHFVLLLPLKDPTAAGILRPNVLRRTLERTYAARTHRLDAVRAHGPVSAARRIDRTGAGDAAGCCSAMSPNLFMRDPYILDFLGGGHDRR